MSRAATRRLTVAATVASGPAATTSRPTNGADRTVAYPDLGAVVHLDGAPDALLAELPGLYSSPFSTLAYFTIYDHVRPADLRVCELDEPHHVLVFTARGASAEVLNKVIDIEPTDMRRAVAAIFRARPELRRLKAEVKFPPDELSLPHRALFRADDQTVELPDSVEEWARSLGRVTRRHLRLYRRRLLHGYPGFHLRRLAGDEVTMALVQQVLAWNRERVVGKGERWLYDCDPEVAHRLATLVRHHGDALCAFVDEELVAAHLRLFVGHDCWGHTGGFLPRLAEVNLGTLMVAFTVSDAIERGCARVHLLWGSQEYKRHMGARPVPAWRVAVYRSRLDKACYVRDRWRVLWRDRADIYWRLRGSLKARLPDRVVAALGSSHPERA